MKSSATRVHYEYRDASNYTFHGIFVVAGDLDVSVFKNELFDREFFIPERVGLPSLVPDSQNEDDHWLHTIAAIEPCEETNTFCSATEFVRRMSAASKEGWFATENDWVLRPKRFR